ncbi:MAG TPA: class I SAM-dependent methyltransferase [Firmicutes bacterium]|nr:class I SAM-dependent methyltransferase [Bacillota bacterium]
MDSTLRFYNAMAGDYHLIFNDWAAAGERHAKMIDALIQDKKKASPDSLKLLDCSCGIGTQTIGLAKLGYNVTASDLSPKAIRRAKREAKRFGVPNVKFKVADFRELERKMKERFDVVISFDNSLPHLLMEKDLELACRNIRNILNDGGRFFASIRDYDKILSEKPSSTIPYLSNDEYGKRWVFQIWEWEERIYTLTLFIIRKTKRGAYKTSYYSTKYRAITRAEFSEILARLGFDEIRWRLPEETRFYQPIVEARKK